MKKINRFLAALICCILMLLPVSTAFAVEDAENLVFNNGTMDGILADGETEKILTIDWLQSYPVATFGGPDGDSPAKIQNVEGNNVLVLEKSSGDFASYFADLSQADDGMVPAGVYELSMDLKPVGDFTTDNVGFNLYSQYNDVRIYDQGWKNCTELENGWLHYSQEFEIAANGVDSIQMWFNTMGSSVLYVDNLSFRMVAQDPDASAIIAEYIAGSGESITVSLPEAPETVAVAEKSGYELEEGLDFTYTDGTVTFYNDYADGLSSGINRLIVTAGTNQYQINLVIKQAKPAVPASSDGYLFQETLVGGDFEMFDEGFAFTMEQVEGWGSNVSYDDPGVIVSHNGNKVLRLQKDQKSSYSSAFAFLSPTIQSGDVLSLSFDYKLDAQDVSIYQGADINFCFVSASNMQMYLIDLDNSCPEQTHGDGDYQWDIQYTDLGDGWTRVNMDFVANNALLSYNSMRFLLPTDRAMEGDAMYVDNVSLLLWANAEPPVYNGGVLTFDKAAPADMFAPVNLNALDPTAITCDGAAVEAASWSVNPAKDTITLAKEFLLTLEAGEHSFTVATQGGECSFAVTVSGTAASAQGAGSPIVWIIGIATVLAIGAAIVIITKKRSK